MRLARLFLFGPLALLCSGNTASGDVNTDLYRAVLAQDLAGMSALLAEGADPNHSHAGRGLLVWATQLGNPGVVSALLAAGANPDEVDDAGYTALMYAVQAPHVTVIEALLGRRPDLSLRRPDGRSLAALAVESGKAEVVRLLLDAGADFGAREAGQPTPALLAAQGVAFSEDTHKIIALLGERGIDVDAGDRHLTPLYFAVMQNDPRLVRSLLAAGADPNLATPAGQLPLVQALASPALFQLLLDAGADPNATTGDGRPLLFVALQRVYDTGMAPESVETLSALVAAGAEVNRTDAAGRTPLEYANHLGLSAAAPLLTERVYRKIVPQQTAPETER